MATKEKVPHTIRTAVMAGASGLAVETIDVKERKSLDIALNARMSEMLAELAAGLGDDAVNTLRGAKIDYTQHRDDRLADVVKTVLGQTQGKNLPSADAAKIDAALARRGAAGDRRVAEALDLDIPVAEHPVLAPVIREHRTREIAGAAKLSQAKADKLIGEGIDIDTVSNTAIETLERTKVLTAAEGKRLRLAGALSRISGSNPDLVSALIGTDATSIDDFIAWERTDWQGLLEDNAIAIPEAEGSAEAYAESLRRAVEESRPSAYLIARVAHTPNRAELKGIESVAARLGDAAEAMTGTRIDPNKLDTRGLSATARRKLTEEAAKVAQLAGRYDGLGVGAVLRNPELSPSDKAADIGKKIDALDRFLRNNTDLDIYVADFVDKSITFDWNGINISEQRPVRAQLQSMQRILTLTDTPTKALGLMDAGFSSADTIAEMTEAEFLGASGLDTFDAHTLYGKAQDHVASVAHVFEEIRETAQGLFDRLRAGNSPQLVNDLRELDGYEALFGVQNTCNCRHCKSVFSISAYFVGLMRFVSKHVSKRLFEPDHTGHPLYLKRRRPDLWTLDLGCENAKTELPYLTIVNEVLANFVESELAIPDAWVGLAAAQNSVALPADVALEEARIYAADLGVPLHEVLRLTGAGDVDWAREYLGLTPEEEFVIARPDAAGVTARFGNKPLNALDVQDFMAFAELTREEVSELLAMTCYSDIGKVKVKVVEDSSDIQLFSERLQGLTAARLDLIHRVLRLARGIGASLSDTDLLVRALQATGAMATLDAADTAGRPQFLALGPLLALAARLGLDHEAASALAGPLPDTAPGEGERALIDRIFDRAAIFGVAGTASDGTPQYNATATLQADRLADTVAAPLAGGLGIASSELNALLTLLGKDVTTDITVDATLLVQLWRFAQLLRALGRSADELTSLAHLAIGGTAPIEITKMRAVVELHDWLSVRSMAPGEARLVVLGEESGIYRYETTAESVATLVDSIQQDVGTDKLALLATALADLHDLTVAELETSYFGSLTAKDLTDPAIAVALAAPFTDGSPDNPPDLQPLTDLMRALERVQRGITALDLSAEAVAALGATPALWGVADATAIVLDDWRALGNYTDLVAQAPEREADLLTALGNYTGAAFDAEAVTLLAEVIALPAPLVQSVQEALALPVNPAVSMVRLVEAVRAADRLAVDGASLAKLAVTQTTQSAAAAGVLRGAAHTRYKGLPNETEALGDLQARVNELRRDAICAFIIGHYDRFKFRDRGDLYAFFLLDPEMGGCYTTSRVVAAVSSMQTYINRCLLNLEQSDPHLNPALTDLRVDPTWLPAEQWEWSKNYRVWEANRKVFLYPENYIDPALRDDKTHLFKALEDELLQQEVSLSTAEAAYKRYLAGFAELAALRYSGALAQSPPQQWSAILLQVAQTMAGQVSKSSKTNWMKLNADILPVQAFDDDMTIGASPKFFLSELADNRTYYLFARTGRAPNRYYWRTYRPDGGIWGNWQPMDVPIEAKKVSPLIHRGRLYVFWNDVKSKEITKFKDGDSTPGAVRFEVATNYATLNEDGSWSTVQKMPLGAMTVPRDDVYFRILGRFPLDDDERDSTKEDVFAKFGSEVFGKPYAALGNSASEPVKVHYIWSQEAGVQDIVYSTGTVEVNASIFTIRAPSVSFTVTNHQFGEAKQITVQIDFGFFSMNTTAQVRIVSSTDCIIDAGAFSVRVPISSQTIMTSTIYTTRSGLSLARGELTDASVTPLPQRASYLPLSNGLRAFLQPEYTVSRATSATTFYVENNYTSFTGSPRTITQQPWGEASMKLPAELGGLTVVPLSTVLTDTLTEKLYADGLESFLDLSTQTLRDANGQRFDFNGSYGVYYWEMFFHIPFLIGRHCNATGKFKEARWWYERIFNPTSPESPADVKPSDHNWRFSEFRNVSLPKLKDILTDTRAIETYKKDPFDPHAIAALRRSAYMKTVVMAYVDNLLDWADMLFARDTRESVTEALGLYRFARDVLGDKPVEAGDCKTASALTYEIISKRGKTGSEFLVTLENVLINQRNGYEFSVKALLQDAINQAEVHAFAREKPGRADLKLIETRARAERLTDKVEEAKLRLKDDTVTKLSFENGSEITAAEAVTQDKLDITPRYGMAARRQTKTEMPKMRYADVSRAKFDMPSYVAETLAIDRARLADVVVAQPWRPLPGPEVVRMTTAAFCVPRNTDLLGYWDRIDLQLFKIRNCQNIDGQRRRLALTAPPIDPMMLVRARAAGLSLEEIGALAAGALQPTPYRFKVTLQLARQAAGMLRDFGGALLSALEKKDAEELRRMQLTHERNLQGLTRGLRERRIQEAQKALESAQTQQEKAEKRVEQLDSLISDGLNNWEVLEEVSTHSATALKLAESVVHLMAGITYLVPQVGSPFSMKYGGKELGDSGVEFALWTSAMAGIFNQLASSAKLEANHQRREQTWRNERELSRKDVIDRTAQTAIAEIRLAIAQRELEILERERDQTAERERFHKDKFTGLGLYTHLASTLGRLYRRAYTVAYAMAREAERAYQFETDQTDFFIAADNWDSAYAGLLSGEKLQMQLAELEQAFLRTSERREEIRQAFSLALLDPAELVRLRQTGSCTIRIPEIAFEIVYPGQYRRIIKGLRVSVPSVIGPRTNLGARLTLLRGDIRPEAGQPLQERLAGKNEAISLSRGIDDTGTHEFSYQGERYMPFEGAGAVSEWRLELPASVRSFDYGTISDVILDLDYTALQGDRGAADAALGAAVTAHAATTGLHRLFSLRHEMPDVWARLTMAPPAAPGDVAMTLEDRHFPLMLQGRALTAESLQLYLRPETGGAVAPPALALDGTAVTWSAAQDIALPGATGETGKLKGGGITMSGPVKRDWVFTAAEGALHGIGAGDLMLVLRYRSTLA